jgi:UDP-N-acetylmuramoylalanine--D-glutamate ligase
MAAGAYGPAGSRQVWFSSKGRADIYLRDGAIYTTLAGGSRSEVEVIRVNEIQLPGLHNIENVMAALGATFCALSTQASELTVLRDSIRRFKGVEHRIEFVAEVNGVRFYNDSKATNVDSTRKALEAFERNVVLILGGKDKGSDYTGLAPLIAGRVKRIVLIGAASEKIARQLAGSAPMVRAGSMEAAVARAAEAAAGGDVVLLAPACASFDMFDNYEHRGRVFKDEVHKLSRQDGD